MRVPSCSPPLAASNREAHLWRLDGLRRDWLLLIHHA